MRPISFFQRLRDERGITGIETAIVLISFVVVAAVLSFVVLSTGLFSAERGRETVFAGIAKTRGSLSLTGGVIATSDGTQITDLTMAVVLAAGGDSVSLDPAAAKDRTVIGYVDRNVSIGDLTYTVETIVGSDDNVLSQGELMEISIDLTQNINIYLVANSQFTLEIKPPSGSYLVVRRTIPPSISNTIIDLH